MKDLGKRRYKRVEVEQLMYLFATPRGAGVRCHVKNVSEGGICVDVGDSYVPDMFGIAFKQGGNVARVCEQVWRRGSLIGARYKSIATKNTAPPPIEI